MSEKPMTELLQRVGIIDKHIVEFQKWRLIDETGVHADTRSPQMLIEDLVSDIAELLDKEPIMRQTLVAPVFTRFPPRLWCVVSFDGHGIESEFHAVKDEMGRLLVDGRAKIHRGDTTWCEDAVHEHFTVVEVEDLYENDKVIAKMITIEKE